MAVSENDLVVGPLTPATGVTTISLDFFFEDARWLEVYKSGSETPLVLDGDYTVTGAGTSSGVVTLSEAANGTDAYSIYLAVPLRRSSDMQLRGEFKSGPFNIEMDRIWQRLQFHWTHIGRSLRVGATSTMNTLLSSVSAGQLFRLAEDGSKIVGIDLPLSLTVSEVDAWFQARDAISAAQAASLADGSVVALNGRAYVVDSSATGTGSATNDLGVNGLVPFGGTVEPQHFGAAGDNLADDQPSIQAAADFCRTAKAKLSFPRKTYRIASPVTFTGIDVDMNGSVLRYDGAPGSFALTFNSDSGGGTSGLAGNRISDFALEQRNWAEYVSNTGSKTYDPPSIAGYSNVTNISGSFVSTTVSVPGAREGGFCRATFDNLAAGIVLCAEVTADDVVTVYFNSYRSDAVDMASGTLDVTAINNAYHGLCIGGGLGVVNNYRVVGFTGVSVGVGSGLCQYTGVRFPASQENYYMEIDGNIAPAGGWGLVVQPRNNANRFSLSTFPLNAYSESPPRRSNCINQAVFSGIANTIEAMSLEASPSEAGLIISDSCVQLRGAGSVYMEYNTSWATPPEPYVRAEQFSAANELTFWVNGGAGKIADLGVGNNLRNDATYYINGSAVHRPQGGHNLVKNGDFENKLNGWSDFSTGTTISYPGAGVFSGRRVRFDLVDGRLNVLQNLIATAGLTADALDNRTFTAGAWIKTNVPGLSLKIGANSSVGVPSDEIWHYIPATIRTAAAETIVQLLHTSSFPTTGYVEVSNVTCVIGNTGIASGAKTKPEGTASYNAPSLADGARTTTTISVPGAELGDHVLSISASIDVQGLKLWGYVSAADTVSVVVENNTGGVVDLGSATLRAIIEKGS